MLIPEDTNQAVKLTRKEVRWWGEKGTLTTQTSARKVMKEDTFPISAWNGLGTTFYVRRWRKMLGGRCILDFILTNKEELVVNLKVEGNLGGSDPEI